MMFGRSSPRATTKSSSRRSPSLERNLIGIVKFGVFEAVDSNAIRNCRTKLCGFDNVAPAQDFRHPASDSLRDFATVLAIKAPTCAAAHHVLQMLRPFVTTE